MIHLATGIAIKRGVRPSLSRVIEEDVVLYYQIPAGATENLNFEAKDIALNPISLDIKISYDNGITFSDCNVPISVNSSICPNPIIKAHMLYTGDVILQNFTGSLKEAYIAYPKILKCNFANSNIIKCKINVASIKDLSGMFMSCTKLVGVKIVGLGSLYPNYGTNLRHLFYNCSNLVDVSISDTRYVTSMDGVFRNCTSLMHGPRLDTRNVTDMGSMFEGCTSLVSIQPMDTSNVMDMDYMFMRCTSLATKPNIFIKEGCSTRNMYYGTTLS